MNQIIPFKYKSQASSSGRPVFGPGGDGLQAVGQVLSASFLGLASSMKSSGLLPGPSSLLSSLPVIPQKGGSSGLREAVFSGPPASGGPFNLNLLANSPDSPRETIPKGMKKNQKRDEKEEVFPYKAHRYIRCGSWALVRSCSDGHTFAKSLDCGREWCEKCRTSSHGRRMGRWLPKAQKIKEMAYLIITLPVYRRPRTASGLRKIDKGITEILKRWGFARGLRRWHTYGDKSVRWNPHLNFLMDGGFLSERHLEFLKKEIYEFLKVEKAVVYYQYTQSVGKILHWLKYVTRPTFLNESWDFEMAEELHNFRNSAWWGKWDDDDKWNLPEKEKKLAYYKKIEAGVCSTCGKKLEGGRVVSTDLFVDEKNPGWEQIWKNVWQYKGPPENVLMYRLLKDFALLKNRATIVREKSSEIVSN